MKNKKRPTKRLDELIGHVELALQNCKKGEGYLFVGKDYRFAFDGIAESTLKNGNEHLELHNVTDFDFDIDHVIEYCTVDSAFAFPDNYRVVLCLKNNAKRYQKKLLTALERLTLPLIIFADSDCFTVEFISRFSAGHVYKVANETINMKSFVRIDRKLGSPFIGSPYDCPQLVKLGDYENLSTANKKIDILIGRLSGDGSVYSEMLAVQTTPIEGFDDKIKLEALSALHDRARRMEGCKND